MVTQVARDCLYGRRVKLFLERGRGEGGVEVSRYEGFCLRFRDEIAAQRALMNLRQGVMERLSVADGFMQWRVEAVKEPQLELVRTLEEILELAKAEDDVRRLPLRARWDLRLR